MEMCEVCTIQNFKYKCPKCRLKYCSVSCFKLHTENACVKESEEEEEVKEESFLIDKIGSEVPMLDEEPDLVPEDKLERLGKNKAVLESLQNPHLRKMITAIAAGENADSAIHSAMMEPLFVEFVDKCLNVVEPQAENMEEEGSEEEAVTG